MQKTLHLLALLTVLLLSACSTKGPVDQQAATSYQQPSTAFNPAADEVLLRAIGLVGTPYVWGGNTPSSGFDCSGLIGFVYQEVAGIRLPRTTQQMLHMPGQQIARNQLQSGDIIFFATAGRGRVSHAGIYVGEGRFVHAPSNGGTVRLDSVNAAYWNKAYLQAKRVLSSESMVSNP
ncbi:MAG: C40 family peptidase [Gammaproteobacteria bacterium]|nr:C40 family peptidase [Gammaproteobacteria bacterium]